MTAAGSKDHTGLDTAGLQSACPQQVLQQVKLLDARGRPRTLDTPLLY